ncbi:MAG: pentapeptide repeat-containing protein [Candidatus Thiodiazotropha sp. (ex Ctena orbiculata)]|nr:pentapeptide repeat-containing protein [Candidatus Thiodiazotropha taylori]MBT2997624.1 pentapeptide repeat-containing protein [Candidatus Thiodiazotropha taylori]MBT3001955.1 pentapeptide repeat-containing protein [Candidatus Thiodiazotropha taylori]MBV2107797.1 pentapeptide repeat-containing protein [Candidatus Thiodiazotropha taylori]MBV2111312.1 pentapeptide repeat-containing protein [Candidatus Thiodiazotropha taylori]
MQKPQLKQNPMYQLLKEGKIEEFNQRRAAGEPCDLRNADLRGVDLRDLDARNLDLSGAYLRHTDLRGLDLSETNLEGASINSAKISGTYFASSLSAEEITLSLVHGTRLRNR